MLKIWGHVSLSVNDSSFLKYCHSKVFPGRFYWKISLNFFWIFFHENSLGKILKIFFFVKTSWPEKQFPKMFSWTLTTKYFVIFFSWELMRKKLSEFFFRENKSANNFLSIFHDIHQEKNSIFFSMHSHWKTNCF